MPSKWITVEFLGGPLDGALRPVQAGVEFLYLANGAIVHGYALDEIHEGYCVRQVMRHFESLNASSWIS